MTCGRSDTGNNEDYLAFACCDSSGDRTDYRGTDDNLVCGGIGGGISPVFDRCRDRMADRHISGRFHRPADFYKAVGPQVCQQKPGKDQLRKSDWENSQSDTAYQQHRPDGGSVYDGQEWTARSVEDDGTIEAGKYAVVEKIEGVKLIVREKEESNMMNASTIMSILGIILLILIVLILISCIKIVHQAQALVVERLGAYQATWGVGIHFKIPIIERVARRIDLKEQVVDFEPQAVITKDNVTMQIDTVVFYQITDPKMFCYGVANPIMAIENLTATTLRNIIGDLELDQTLTSRETINTKMRASLDVATDPWGIKVTRVELKNIIPPAAIQDAMEKQMKAERERREAILRAEGEKKSTVLVAEGHKESAILNAEADKQAAILRAEAEKEATIREAEGQAEAILKVQQATADGIRFLKEAGADDAVLTMKSLEAFEKAADGKATKIIIPSEIQGIAGLVKSLTEVGAKEEDTK